MSEEHFGYFSPGPVIRVVSGAVLEVFDSTSKGVSNQFLTRIFTAQLLNKAVFLKHSIHPSPLLHLYQEPMLIHQCISQTPPSPLSLDFLLVHINPDLILPPRMNSSPNTFRNLSKIPLFQELDILSNSTLIHVTEHFFPLLHNCQYTVHAVSRHYV